jgi:hypothetical protein
MSAAAKFQRAIGAEVAKRLGFKFLKSRAELRTEVSDGHHVIILAGSNKYSPLVEVAFYFGKNFAAARRIEKRLGIYAFPYHIQQYSPNFDGRGFAAYRGPCSWSVDIDRLPPDLIDDLLAAIDGLAFPFFERYGDIRVARDAIADNDRDVFGGRLFWPQLLSLDLALDEVEHFVEWSAQLDELSRAQANEIIGKFRARRQ